MSSVFVLVPLISTLILSGCAIGNQHFGRAIDAGNVARIEAGTSTKQDVLDLFGPPTYHSWASGAAPSSASGPDRRSAIETPDGEDIFTYEYREEGERFFTVLLFTRFSRTAVADTLMVFFDSRDVVRYVAFAKESGRAARPEKAP